MSSFSVVSEYADRHAPCTWQILWHQDYLLFANVWFLLSSFFLLGNFSFIPLLCGGSLPPPCASSPPPAAAALSSLNNLQHKFASGRSSTASAFGRANHSSRSLGYRQDQAACSQPAAVSHSKKTPGGSRCFRRLW